MDKKQSNRFTLVFNPIDSQQEFAIQKLNSLPPRAKAIYIAQAICSFEKRSKSAPINNQEKRKRGRPPKKVQDEEIQSSKSTEIKTSSVSLSHIQENPKNAYVAPNTSDDGISGDMVDSMMDFIGRR